MDPKKFDPELLKRLTVEELVEVNQILDEDPVLWRPLEGPQTLAMESQADVIGFGGAGGGGKSDWLIGLALTQHRRSIVFRETGTELVGINNRLREILTTKGGQYSGREQRWTFVRNDQPCEIELGAFPDLGDEQKYRGRDHDGLFFDEATNMRREQVTFLFAWARTVIPTQRVRICLTFNPPSTVEGQWIIEFFAPWLDDKHPNPATPGEIRWFATIDGVDVEVPDNKPFVLTSTDVPGCEPVKRTRVYVFDAKDHKPEDIITASSRTFIPSRITDNPFLAKTGYMRRLQGLPEPLRSQMLLGDFRAGMRPDSFQVCPTAWVDAAMARWKKPIKLAPQDSLGVDVAMNAAEGRGDEHVIIARHGMWFGEPVAHPSHDVQNGSKSGSLVVAELRDEAVIHVDLFGVGSLTYGFLMGLQLQVIGVNFGDLVPQALDKTGKLRFANLRSMLWWRMREALDPMNNTGIALPPHKRLRADLCAPKWSVPGQVIKVQSRDDILKTLGRSPDYGTAAILALIDTPKTRVLTALFQPQQHVVPHSHDPYSVFDRLRQ